MSETSRQVVLKSLAAIGAKKDAEFYAGLFAQQEPGQFACLVIDPRCLEVPLLDSLISDLQFLAELSLYPVLICPERAADMLTALKEYEIAAKGVLSNPSDIRAVAADGIIPVVQDRRKDSRNRLTDMLLKIAPGKVIFLHPTGGLERRGQRIDVVNLDELGLALSGITPTPGQEEIINVVSSLSPSLPRRTTYVMASPLNLLEELFTTKGAGTLFRRASRITVHKTELDKAVQSLAPSIENGFGRRLKPDYLESDLLCVLEAGEGRGGAILREVGGLPYLSKFWVTREAQGEGIGKDVWQAMSARFPSLFWRSRRENSFNSWYMQVCDGMQVEGSWRVFWIGLRADVVADIVKAALAQPVDFEN